MELQSLLKEWMSQAHLQMTKGCGRDLCLNLHCAACPLNTQKDPNQAAAYLLRLAQSLQKIPAAPEFLFCPTPSAELHPMDLNSLSLAETLSFLRVPGTWGTSLHTGCCSVSSSGVDWAALSVLEVKLLSEPGSLSSAIAELPLDEFSLCSSPRLLVMLLGNNELLDLDNSGALVKLLNMLSPSGLQLFSSWVDELTAERLQEMLSVCQQFLTIKILDKQFSDEDIQEYECTLQVMDALYGSNEKNNRIQYQEFYNDAVNREIDTKTDYTHWINGKYYGSYEFAFANFPWVLDAFKKSLFLTIESNYKMIKEIERGIVNMMSPFVNLEVRREFIIEDTLTQLLSGEFNIKKPLSVHFVDEEGVDEGGVQKEFFQLIVKELFDPAFSMFSYFEETRYY